MLHRLAILADLDVTTPERLKALQNAAKVRDIMVSTHIAKRADDIVPAIDAAVNAGAQALNVLASSLFSRYRKQIFDQTATACLSAIYQWPEMAEESDLKTAKTLGITVPPALLARADEVIE